MKTFTKLPNKIKLYFVSSSVADFSDVQYSKNININVLTIYFEYKDITTGEFT